MMNNTDKQITQNMQKHRQILNKTIQWLTPLLVTLLITLPSQAQPGINITYYHNDALGSPAAATNEQGDVIWRKTYRPYGSELDNGGQAAKNNRISYTGHTLDNETGLVYAGARYYNPEIGRFMSIDPVGFQEGNIQSFNKYAYGNNNPYRYKDPTGNIPVETIWDVANIGLGLASLSDNLANKNYGWAIVDTVGIVLDVGATVVPYVPGGAGTFIKTSRVADNAIKTGTDIVQQLAKQQYKSGFQHLKQFMSPKEIKAYLADPSNGSRFLGTAVHRATAEVLEKIHPGRFDYNATRPFDFIDKATGQAIELTTKKGVKTHKDRGADIITYD